MSKKLLVIVSLTILVIYLVIQVNHDEDLTLILSEEPNQIIPVPSRILYCHPYKESYVLVQTTNEVLLLSSETGETIWLHQLSDYYLFDYAIDSRSAIKTGMQVEKGILISHRGDGAIRAIEIETGKLLWEDLSKVGESIYSIYIQNETIFVALHNDSVIAYDLYTGRIKWSVDVPHRTALYVFGYEEKVYLGTNDEIYEISFGILSTPVELNGLINEMESDLGKVYISYLDSSVSFSSLSLSPFQQLWRIDENIVHQLESTDSSILIDNNIIYYSGEDIVAINKENGEFLWRSNYSDDFGKPMIIGNLLFAQGRQKMFIVDKHNGVVIQSIVLKGGFRLSELMLGEKVNPCANSNTVWIARGNKLYVYNTIK